MTDRIVPELDVLIAAAIWLWQRGVPPFRLSLPAGSENPKWEDRRRLTDGLRAAGIPDGTWHTASDGPDIEARSMTEHWRVECKGAGRGVQQTQRNNFDRALASVVSYYEDSRDGLEQTLGLALPKTDEYLAQLTRRVRAPLRQRLNLWVLLYNPSSGPPLAVSPDADYPPG